MHDDYQLLPPPWTFVATAILAVLGVWKIVEIIVWLFNHVHFT